MTEHVHLDSNYHLSTCQRCRDEYQVRRATDPLTVEAPEPPKQPRWRWSLRRRKR